MKLYIYEHCPFCTRARMIFGLKGIPVELSVVMEGDDDTPIRLVGKKGVPILERDDGSAMSESMDIVRYVDGRFPEKVLTEPLREEIDAWCLDARPIVAKLAVPRMTRSSFKENSTDESRTAYVERERKAFGDLDALIRDTPDLLDRIHRRLASLDLLIEDWAGLSESDLVLYSTLRSLSIVKGVVFGLNTTRFARRLSKSGGVPLLDDKAM